MNRKIFRPSNLAAATALAAISCAAMADVVDLDFLGCSPSGVNDSGKVVMTCGAD